MSEPDDLHALTARYFDGELTGDDVDRALDHLTTCAACQRELGDHAGLEVRWAGAATARSPTRARSSRSSRSPPGPAPRGGRRVGGGGSGPAAVVWIAARPARVASGPPALALAPHRGVEVRFSAPAFAPHRPYQVMRGSGAPETFTLEALAGLERRGEQAALVAAQASAGELPGRGGAGPLPQRARARRRRRRAVERPRRGRARGCRSRAGADAGLDGGALNRALAIPRSASAGRRRRCAGDRRGRAGLGRRGAGPRRGVAREQRSRRQRDAFTAGAGDGRSHRPAARRRRAGCARA
jgi:hypothetical protein